MARAAKPAQDRPAPDAIEGVPLPRDNPELIGHAAAEQALLEAYRSGRMHHGWLLTGESGIGRATLAFRLARFVLANPDPASPAVHAARDLSVDPEHPAGRMMSLGTHPDLLHLQRPWDEKNKRYRTEVSVDTVRRIIPFLGTTAGEGGWRIIIADPADEMNRSAANALLKNLEEPPKRTLFLLVAESKGSLPPTIASRCRTLQMQRLSDGEVESVLDTLGVGMPAGPDRDVALAIAAGRPRRMIELVKGDGIALYRQMLRAIEKADPDAQLKLSAAAGDAQSYSQVMDLMLGYIHRRVRNAPEPEPGSTPPPLPLVTWAELWEKATVSGLEVEAYNLDRRQFLLDVLETVAAAARSGTPALR